MNKSSLVAIKSKKLNSNLEKCQTRQFIKVSNPKLSGFDLSSKFDKIFKTLTIIFYGHSKTYEFSDIVSKSVKPFTKTFDLGGWYSIFTIL